MGFISTNGVHTSNLNNLNTITTTNTVHTSNLNNLNTITTTNTGYYNVTFNKIGYDVMGEVVEIDGEFDQFISMNISLINTIGIKYYVELKKNGIIFHEKIRSILERNLKISKRNESIEKIIG